MPPHLHPRSRSTTSLFTTCLTVSFLVVGMPHILPCPVNPRQFNDSAADAEPKKQRRRRKTSTEDGGVGVAAAVVAAKDGVDAGIAQDVLLEERRRRECPVPKPGGVLGQVMGFGEVKEREAAKVIVKPLRERG